MSISAMLVLLLSTSGKTIKFGCINNATCKPRTFFGQNLNTATGMFFDVVRNQSTPLNLEENTVTYFAESEDNFAEELNRIQAFREENETLLSKHPELTEFVICNEPTFAPFVRRCAVFDWYQPNDIRNETPEFIMHAKSKWVELMNERRDAVVELLLNDKAEFAQANNTDAVTEVDAILAAIARDVATETAKVQGAWTYSDLVKIWPPTLLPRPKHA